jgi:hypothetical protein
MNAIFNHFFARPKKSLNYVAIFNWEKQNTMKFYLILFFALGISLGCFSQETDDLSTYNGKWVVTDYNKTNEWFAERFYKMDAAELAKYHATTEKLLTYLGGQSVAQNPLGVTFEVKSRTAYNHYDHELYPVKPSERVKAEVFIPFCSLYRKNGKVEAACDEVPYIDVITNNEREVFESGMNYDQLDDKQAVNQYKEMFYLPGKLLDLGSGVFMYNWYYKNRLVVARSDRPLWLPVTNREYIERMMVYSAASFKEGKSTQMLMDMLKAEIASIPLEIMGLPCYVDRNAGLLLTEIVITGEISEFPVYKLNPDYFDKTLPRTAVQLLTMTIEGHADFAEYGETASHRVWEFISGLKGSDLVKLLDVK